MTLYPTDEELQDMIEELEGQKLYAPRNLKEQIFERIAAIQVPMERIPDKEEADIKKSGKQKMPGLQEKSRYQPVSFFWYSAKMAAGMAVAIAMLIFLPIQNSRAEELSTASRKEQQFLEEHIKRENQNRERAVYKEEQEAKRLKQKAREEAREEAWENSVCEAEEKIENLWNGFDNLWNWKAEEN